MNPPRTFFQRATIIAFLFVAMIIVPLLLVSQNHDEIRADFHAANETLRSALNRFADENKINLTYNASDKLFDAQINYSVSNGNVLDVLSDLLAFIGHTYQQVGNHFVIVKAPKTHIQQQPKPAITSSPSPPTKASSTPDTVIKHVEVPIMVRDTMFITDTIVMVEHELVRDTVFVEVPVTRSNRARPVALNGNVLRFEPERTQGWAASVYYTHMAAGYQIVSINDVLGINEVRDSESLSFRNFGLGAEMQYNTGNLMFQAGLSVNSFANRFYYSELFTSGGFTKTDTLDIFFTIIQADTVWKYVTDTTWIPLNRQEVLYDRMNRIGLLEMNLSIAFSIYNGDNVSLYLKAGSHAGIPLWLRGNTIQNSEDFTAEKLNREVFSDYVFGYQTSLGGKMKLSDWTDIYAELFYKRYLGETVLNYPLGRRLHGAGLKLGFLYYF